MPRLNSGRRPPPPPHNILVAWNLYIEIEGTLISERERSSGMKSISATGFSHDDDDDEREEDDYGDDGDGFDDDDHDHDIDEKG